MEILQTNHLRRQSQPEVILGLIRLYVAFILPMDGVRSVKIVNLFIQITIIDKVIGLTFIILEAGPTIFTNIEIPLIIFR